MTGEGRRFKRLVITELFGPGSDTIDISFRLDERVTILHGRNGAGKTITLELIEALRQGHYRRLLETPFTELRLETSDGATLTLTPTSNATPPSRRRPSDGRDIPLLHYSLTSGNGPADLEGDLTEEGLDKSLLESDLLTQWRHPTNSRPSDTPGARIDDTLRAIRTFRAQARTQQHQANLAALAEFRDSLPIVKLIRTDRLYLRDVDAEVDADKASRTSASRLMVKHLSQQIRTLVQAADQQYRETSTRLDSTLPQRLFKKDHDTPELEALLTRSNELRAQEERLRALGLLKETQATFDGKNLSRDEQSAFHVILNDREQKLQPFSEVVNKAERLLQSLNSKLAPKTVKFDVAEGYQVLTATGKPLPLESLSSGEQHELVLLHELLFEVPPNSLILIDEPELSLHVTWQQDLLRELMEIAALSNLDFVLATHSPYIIGEGNDALMVRLGAPA
jgi:energy-coupling factor transporter ATP-binding protein EcfA2